MGCSLGCFNPPPSHSPSPSPTPPVLYIFVVCCMFPAATHQFAAVTAIRRLFGNRRICAGTFLEMCQHVSARCALMMPVTVFQARTPSLPRLSIGCLRSWCDKMQKHSLEPPRGTRGSNSQQQGRRHRTYSHNQECGSFGGCWFDSQRCFNP